MKARLLLLADLLARSLDWIVASHHLTTDPACVEHRAPRPGSRLDRVSHGVSCSRCMALRAFGRLEPQVSEKEEEA